MRILGYLMYWMPGILLIITLGPEFSKSSELETSTSRNSSGTAKERDLHGRPGGGAHGGGAAVVGGVVIIYVISAVSCLCCCCGIPLCIVGCVICSRKNRVMDGQGAPGTVMGPYPQGVPQPYYSNMGMQQQYSQPQQAPPQETA